VLFGAGVWSTRAKNVTTKASQLENCYVGLLLIICEPCLTLAQGTPELTTQLTVIDNAAPDAPVLKTPERIKEGFDNCVHENLKTEFDGRQGLVTSAFIKKLCFAGATV
jgi:hypothetical protein